MKIALCLNQSVDGAFGNSKRKNTLDKLPFMAQKVMVLAVHFNEALGEKILCV